MEARMAMSGLVFLLGLLVMWGSGFGLALCWRRQGRRRRATELGPVCGGCGYSVRGLQTFVCPECGKDLRDVGILAPGMSGGSGLGAVVRGGLWSAAVAVVAVIVTAVAFSKLMPVVSTGQQTYSLLAPRSGQYRQVDFHSHGYHVQWPWQQPSRSLILDVVDLTLTPNQGPAVTLVATIEDLGYTYRRADGSTAQQALGLDADAVLDWMKTAGVDTTGDKVHAEAEAVVQTVKDATHGSMGSRPVGAGAPFTGAAGRGARFYSAPWAAAYPATFVLWLIVWGAGLRWAVRGTK